MQAHYFQDIRELMRLCLRYARKEIAVKLKEKTEASGYVITLSQGIKSSTNDRRDYLWIRVQGEASEYWLTLFYNEVDECTGNIHTQIGRIQFWKNINKKTPNAFSMVDNKKRWFIQPENSAQPEDEPTYIGADGYSPEQVANAFLAFIEKDRSHENGQK